MCISLIFLDQLYVGAMLVSEWLAIWEVAKLDSAICCAGREKFLRLISSIGAYANQEMSRCGSTERLLKWSLLRGAKLQLLTISALSVADPYNVLESFISTHGASVRQLRFITAFEVDPAFDALLLQVAQYCPALQVYEQRGETLATHAAVLFSCCKQLLEIRVSSLAISNLAVICRFYFHLISLDVKFEEKVDASGKEMCDIAKLKGLTKLHIGKSDGLKLDAAIPIIAGSCERLSDVALEQLTVTSVMEFACHCAAMQAFNVTLSEPFPSGLLDAIADRWPDLHRLVFCRAIVSTSTNTGIDTGTGAGTGTEAPSLWSEAHTRAVTSLMQRLPNLAQVACVNGAIPWEQSSFFRGPYRYLDSPISAEDDASSKSAPQLLWVTRLSAAALQMILQCRPALSDVAHMDTADPDFLAVLSSASSVKAVSFPSTGVRSSTLDGFAALTTLRMWDIGEGRVEALSELAERSPGITVLNLSFRKRPSYTLFPRVLRHTPALVELAVQAPLHGAENEPPVPAPFYRDVMDTLSALKAALCPSLRRSYLQL